MLKSLLEIMRQLLGLAKDTQDNKDALKALQTRVDTITETLQRVIFELQRLSENEAHEREKMGLRLENVLLRSERVLPPGKVNEHPEFAELQRQIVVLQTELEDVKKRLNQLEK
jgi:predicted RNase H-like nuclease (RuvC/YqgF family)